MRLKSCRAGQGEGWGTGSRQAWSNWAGKAGRAVAAGGSGARDGSSAPAEPHSGATPGSPRSVAAAVAAAAAGPAAQPAAHLDFFNEGCQLVAVPEAAATLLQQRGVCLQCRQQGKAPPGSGAIGINRWNIAQRWASRVPVLHGCTSTGRVSSAPAAAASQQASNPPCRPPTWISEGVARLITGCLSASLSLSTASTSSLESRPRFSSTLQHAG